MHLSYTIRAARSEDVHPLWQLVFQSPDKHIRRLTIAEVDQLQQSGEIYLLIQDGMPSSLVGAAYISAPGASTEAEFGGAYIHEEHRGRGLFNILVRVALADYRTNIDKPQPLVAHVVVGNAAPRRGLEAAGFALAKSDQRYSKDSISGIEAMPSDENGFIHADLYLYQESEYAAALRFVVHEFTGFVEGNQQRIAVNIRLSTYTSGAMREVLDTLS
jgi:hypothetical protein